MSNFIAPTPQPICRRIGFARDILLVFRTRKDMRNEGNKDSQRENGENCAPYETQIITVFDTFLRVNVFVVLNVRAEPTERTSPTGLLFLFAPCRSFARRLILSYAFLRVHIIYY